MQTPIQTIEQLLAHHPFFSDMPPAVIQIIAGCGKNVQIQKDEMMFREGDRADAFYLIREGLIALEIASPKAGPITRSRPFIPTKSWVGRGFSLLSAGISMRESSSR